MSRKGVASIAGIALFLWAPLAAAQVSISLPKITDVVLQAGILPPQTAVGGDHNPGAVMWNYGIETLFDAGSVGSGTWRIELGLGYYETTMAGRNPLLRSSSKGQLYEFSGNLRSLPAVAVYLGRQHRNGGFFFGMSATVAKYSAVNYQPGVTDQKTGASVGYTLSGDTLAFGPRAGYYVNPSDDLAIFGQVAFDRYAFSNLQYTIVGTNKLPDEFPRQISWNVVTFSVGVQFQVAKP